MNGSLKMVKLDFFTMKAQLATYLSLVFIVLMFGFMNSSLVTLCITGAWYVALLSTNIFALQEKNNLDRLYGSVSVQLQDIVVGRYIYVFLNYAVAFIVVIVLYAGFAFFQGKAFYVTDAMLGLSVSFLVFSMISGGQMPIFFNIGYIKAKEWSMVPLVSVMALVALPIFVPALLDMLMQANQALLIVGGILVGCLIQFLSCRISIAAYRKRR